MRNGRSRRIRHCSHQPGKFLSPGNRWNQQTAGKKKHKKTIARKWSHQCSLSVLVLPNARTDVGALEDSLGYWAGITKWRYFVNCGLGLTALGVCARRSNSSNRRSETTRLDDCFLVRPGHLPRGDCSCPNSARQ